MIKIIFEAHGTTFDNEAHLSSGFYDVELSSLGKQQSRELGKRYKDKKFDIIFCSDLQRSYKTANIAFSNKYPIVKDLRLRECNYGDLTRSPGEKIEVEKINRINTPFPKGESYEQTNQRIKSFLKDLIKNYDNKKVMIIGHRATQYGLDYWINNKSLKESLASEFKWQPGWFYRLEKI
jgi:broad specificity phosphatase PhoE